MSARDDDESAEDFLRQMAHVSELPLAETQASEPPVPGEAVELGVIAREGYEVIKEHARGGMGRILIARDRQLGRRVAIKELLSPHKSASERFVREAIVTARLQHPSIVPVHQAGRWPDGEPFYVMKLVAGRPLDAVLAAKKTLEERLALLPVAIAVGEAVAYAHSRGVVHRDLKPNNIMLGDFGETLVIDWGLAKWIGDEKLKATSMAEQISDQQSLDGLVVGTPGFMAPEQAAGADVDERGDVYAIGAILYTMLGGQPPYFDRPRAERLKGVLKGPPLPLSGEIPRALVAVIDRAMARDPGARYPTARELTADLKRFQTGQLVAAHRYSAAERLRLWARRHRVLLGGAAAVLLSAAITGGVALQQIVREEHRADRERDIAVAALAREQARVDELVLAQARATLDADPTTALAWLKRLPVTSPRWREARSIVAEALVRGVSERRVALPSELKDLSFDGEVLYVAGDQLHRWNLANGALEKVTERPPRARALGVPLAAQSPDGSLVANASQSHLWVKLPAAGHDLPLSSAPLKLVVSRDRVALRDDGSVHLFSDAAVPQHLDGARLPADGALALSSDGRWLAAGHAGGLRLWSLPSGAFRDLRTRALPLRAAFSSDKLAISNSDGSCQLWTLAGGEVVDLIRNGSGGVGDLAFSPDGRYVAASRGAVIRLWDLTLGGVRKLHGHRLDVTRLLFSDDGVRLASASLDGTARVWRIAAGAASAPLAAPLPIAGAAALAPLGRALAVAQAGQIRITNLPELTTRFVDAPARALAFSPEGNLLALSDHLRAFGPDGHELPPPALPANAVDFAALALAPGRAAWVSADGRQVTQGSHSFGDDDVVTSIALLADDTFALGLRSGSIRLRTSSDAGYLLHGPPSPVVALTATAAGGIFAVHANGAARLWPPPPPTDPHALLAAVEAATSAQLADDDRLR